MLNRKKPIGIFVDTVCPPSIVEHKSRRKLALREDIINLDKQVAQGSLLKAQFRVSDSEPGVYSVWNIYGQINKNSELLELKELLQPSQEGRNPNIEFPKDTAEYLGYLSGDISLFKRGGYDSLPWPINQLFEKTHTFRQKCRIADGLEILPQDVKPYV